MRLLIDAQLPPALCGWFQERGLVATHVADKLGGQTPDREIAAYVELHELVLVTKDDDFLLRYPPVRSRLLWLRCGNISNRGLRTWLDALARDRGPAARGRSGDRGQVIRTADTMAVIEHNQPAPAKAGVIKTADWILDLGPEGGVSRRRPKVNGGEVVAEGTPEQVAKEPRSFTGHYLAPLLAKGKVRESVAAE